MTRAAKPKEWTTFDALLRQIAQEQFLPIAADDFMALKLAWELILDGLKRSAWQARTVAPESYKFTVTEGDKKTHSGNAVDLAEGNVIERDFWFAFIEALEVCEPFATLQPGKTWADRQPDENSFTFSIAHPGRPIIAGAVTGIEVRICDGELARLKRGRKPNSKTKETYRDPDKFAAIIDGAEGKIRAGNAKELAVWWARQALKAEGIHNEHSETADKQAIYRELRARGL